MTCRGTGDCVDCLAALAFERAGEWELERCPRCAGSFIEDEGCGATPAN